MEYLDVLQVVAPYVGVLLVGLSLHALPHLVAYISGGEAHIQPIGVDGFLRDHCPCSPVYQVLCSRYVFLVGIVARLIVIIIDKAEGVACRRLIVFGQPVSPARVHVEGCCHVGVAEEELVVRVVLQFLSESCFVDKCYGE